MDLYNASTDFAEETDELALSPKEYEDRVKELTAVIDRGVMMKELSNDYRYQALINDGLLTASKDRLVGIMTMGGVAKSVTDGAANDLVGMGVLNAYVRDIYQQADSAKIELKALEEAWELHIETVESEAQA